jgi:hypothetical protein
MLICLIAFSRKLSHNVAGVGQGFVELNRIEAYPIEGFRTAKIDRFEVWCESRGGASPLSRFLRLLNCRF